MADPASAALTGPQLFSERPIHGTDEAGHHLNDAERARASAIADARRHRAYVTARLLWRQGATQFAQTQGLTGPDFNQLPPSGAVTPADAPFQSSLCHTDSLVLAAFNRDAIGVDAEPLDRSLEWERLAERWFAAAETQWLSAQPDPMAAFLMLWTLKEAWIKATRRGIAGNLQGLVLNPDSGLLMTDRGGPAWCAATTTHHGHRISVLWQGGAEPEWPQAEGIDQVCWHLPEVTPQ